MKDQYMVTKPFFGKNKFILAAVFLVSALMTGSNLYSQNEDAPKSRQPEGKQHGAQNDEDPAGKKNSNTHEVKDLTPEDMANNMSSMLAERLSLNTNQRSQVYEIILSYTGTHQNSAFDVTELNGKIEEVLTQEQKNNFREFINNSPPLEYINKGNMQEEGNGNYNDAAPVN